jgi:hypothetical protein
MSPLLAALVAWVLLAAGLLRSQRVRARFGMSDLVFLMVMSLVFLVFVGLAVGPQ